MACKTCHEGSVNNVNEMALLDAAIKQAAIWGAANNIHEIAIYKEKGIYKFCDRTQAAGKDVITYTIV